MGWGESITILLLASSLIIGNFEFELNHRLPFREITDSDAQKEKVLGMREMAVPMLAGILSAFRRVISRRISIKVSINSILI